MDIFPLTDFNCTSFTGMCIFTLKNCLNVLQKYLGTDYRNVYQYNDFAV